MSNLLRSFQNLLIENCFGGCYNTPEHTPSCVTAYMCVHVRVSAWYAFRRRFRTAAVPTDGASVGIEQVGHRRGPCTRGGEVHVVAKRFTSGGRCESTFLSLEVATTNFILIVANTVLRCTN